MDDFEPQVRLRAGWPGGMRAARKRCENGTRKTAVYRRRNIHQARKAQKGIKHLRLGPKSLSVGSRCSNSYGSGGARLKHIPKLGLIYWTREVRWIWTLSQVISRTALFPTSVCGRAQQWLSRLPACRQSTAVPNPWTALIYRCLQTSYSLCRPGPASRVSPSERQRYPSQDHADATPR